MIRLKKYDFILVSVISPLKKQENLLIKIQQTLLWGPYKCNLKELIYRDTKNLYAKAKNIIKNLIGYNSNINYEGTNYKKIIVNTAKETVKESLAK